MRMSVIDPYYKTDADGVLAVFYEFYLDGEAPIASLEADDEEGWVLTYDYESFDEFETNLLRKPEDKVRHYPIFKFGKVRLEREPNAPKTPHWLD